MRGSTIAGLAAAVVLTLVGAGLALAGLSRDGQPAAAPLPASESTSPTHTDPSSSGPNAAPQVQAGLAANSIRIPTLGVTATIGTADLINGVLDPPLVRTEVGAWSGSAPLDAATGEVTLAGHVHWTGMGGFTFAKLASLHVGDLIYTTDSHANQTAWRVTAVTARNKNTGVDPSSFAGTHGPRTLALITCGGAYDTTTHSYDQNIYVKARPTRPT